MAYVERSRPVLVVSIVLLAACVGRDDRTGSSEPSRTEECTYELLYGSCPPGARIWRRADVNPGFETGSRRLALRLEEGAVEAGWGGVEPSADEPGVWLVSLDVDGTVEQVRLWVDPNPLESFLSMGDRVRLSFEDVAPTAWALLRLERVSDEALLVAILRWEGVDSLAVAGLGATLEPTSPCDELGYVSSDCPSVAVRGYALRVGDAEVPLSTTRVVTTTSGTYRISNLTMYGESTGSHVSCPAACAVGVPSVAHVDVVRTE